MPSLDDLKKRLYKPGEQFKERMSTPELERASRERRIKWGEGKPPEPKKSGSGLFWGSVIAFVVIVGGGLVFFLSGFPSFLQIQDIEVEIIGESEVQSGNLAVWDVKLTNKSGAPLNDVVIVFNYPQDATPGSSLARVITGLSDNKRIFRERRPIGTLAARSNAQESFDAFVFGKAGGVGNVSVVVEYRPEGASAIFAKDNAFSFVIARSPVSVSFDLPQQIRSGQAVEINLNYISQSSRPIDNLYVKASLPRRFEVSSISPPPLGVNIPFEVGPDEIVWSIGSLSPAQSGKIIIKGKSEGAELEPKNFTASIGIYDESVGSFLSYDEAFEVVVLRPMFLEVTVLANGKEDYVSKPSDIISMEVKWRNNLPVSITNAVLEVVFDPDVVDLQSLRVENGAYSSLTNSIIWNAGSYGQFASIAPGDSGTVKFRFMVKSNLARDSASQRPTIKVDAELRSTTVPPGYEGVDITGSYQFTAPVSSSLQLVASALHFNSPISNSGPLPPKVGEETTYTILWSLANMSNDVENIVVRATIPPNIEFKNIIVPSNAELVYNHNTGVVEWFVDFLPAGTGFTKPALQIAFQIGLIPSLAQVGSAPTIIEEAVAKGKDRYIDEILTSTVPRITTALKDDPSVGFNQRNVVK